MKKKILILTMILFVLINLINVTSFAATEIPLPSGLCQYYVIFRESNNRYLLATSDSPFVYDQSKDQIVIYTDGRVYKYWTQQGGSEFTYTSTGYNFGTPPSNRYYQLIASNHDIYYGTREEMGTSVFFSGPPQQIPLREVMEEMDFGMILRTFSAGLILLIGLMISAISFRKGWAFLQGQLKS